MQFGNHFQLKMLILPEYKMFIVLFHPILALPGHQQYGCDIEYAE